MRFRLLENEVAVEMFDTLAPFIQRALDKTKREGMTVDDYYELLVNDLVSVLTIADHDDFLGIMIVGMDEDDLHVYTLTANLPQGGIERVVEWLDEIAEELNAKQITCHGRRGWIRRLKHLGFKQEYNGNMVKGVN